MSRIPIIVNVILMTIQRKRRRKRSRDMGIEELELSGGLMM